KTQSVRQLHESGQSLRKSLRGNDMEAGGEQSPQSGSIGRCVDRLAVASRLALPRPFESITSDSLVLAVYLLNLPFEPTRTPLRFTDALALLESFTIK